MQNDTKTEKTKKKTPRLCNITTMYIINKP